MRQEIVHLVDDIDGSPAERSILVVDPDGIGYEIDLNTEHLDQYEDAISKLVAAGRRVGKVSHGQRTHVPAKGRAARHETQAIREWAREHGHEVKDRGRIPAEVVSAYHAAVA